ncbi:cytochrome c family protein [Asticcacaulis sp. AND118]|uniref:c-type cytochrome n=1 Tax=Asticcacaulis sp. AND118 TaxID=2840468 RepID=UPI001CFFC40E|nr:c-type cytochrome [Asticcacaulis sp. AND118]UDF04903.1 c-type cytochrome [Asticcacaulis sp. AND118]
MSKRLNFKPLAGALILVACVTPAQAQDAVAGKKAFGACMSCHSVKPSATGIGPSLAGVVGKKAGTNDAKFKYSAAMKAAPAWSEAQLDRFLSDPKAAVPGNTMAMAPTKDAKKRADIIAYLKAN